jgi:hypothetical protein
LCSHETRPDAQADRRDQLDTYKSLAHMRFPGSLIQLTDLRTIPGRRGIDESHRRPAAPRIGDELNRDFRFGFLERRPYTPAPPARPDIFVAGRFQLPGPRRLSPSRAWNRLKPLIPGAFSQYPSPHAASSPKIFGQPFTRQPAGIGSARIRRGCPRTAGDGDALLPRATSNSARA